MFNLQRTFSMTFIWEKAFSVLYLLMVNEFQRVETCWFWLNQDDISYALSIYWDLLALVKIEHFHYGYDKIFSCVYLKKCRRKVKVWKNRQRLMDENRLHHFPWRLLTKVLLTQLPTWVLFYEARNLCQYAESPVGALEC